MKPKKAKKDPASSINSRIAAIQSLLRIYSGAQFSDKETDKTIVQFGLSGREKNLYVALVFRTLEKTVTADYVTSLVIAPGTGELLPAVKAALRLGVTQLLSMDGIKEHAACYETVEAVKEFTHRGAASFVNAVLRSVQRMGNEIPWPAQNSPDYLPVKYSVSREIVDLLVSDYGKEQAEEILSGSCCKLPTAVRTNTTKVTDELFSATTGSVRFPEVPHALFLPDGLIPKRTPGFGDGLFFVQGIASQLAVLALDAKPGMTVVDCCASPGGKSFGAAVAMNGTGRVVSLDVSKTKIRRIEEDAARLCLGNITTAVCDGMEGDPSLDGTADRVICDVPCSAIGNLSKSPEIRFRETDLSERLPELQLQIASRAADYLKPGGRMVYSTCTLNRRENSGVVAELLRLRPFLALKEDRTVFPDKNTGGFYFAVLEREV